MWFDFAHQPGDEGDKEAGEQGSKGEEFSPCPPPLCLFSMPNAQFPIPNSFNRLQLCHLEFKNPNPSFPKRPDTNHIIPCLYDAGK